MSGGTREEVMHDRLVFISLVRLNDLGLSLLRSVAWLLLVRELEEAVALFF